jgi:hypothetical protein
MVVFPFFRRLSLLIIAICSSNGVDQPKFSDLSAHPRTTINTNVGVAQGIAPIDFGFFEPAVRGAIAKTATHGQTAPKASGDDSSLVSSWECMSWRSHQQFSRC